MADTRTVKLRTVVRTAFTRNLNRLKEELCAANIEKESIQVSFEIVEKKASELAVLDAKIIDSMLEQDDADLEEEIRAADEYQRNFLDVRLRVSNILSTQTENGTSTESRFISTLENSTEMNSRKKIKLPKLELRKFNGDIREWVQFWSQFEKIHEDPEIASEDKFQYLIQTTAEGSRARELVGSFPPTKENYEKAISSLKSRFGREDLLVEFYVRELLKLVLQNAQHSSKGLASLCGLYDRLESQLRALETLGVTTDRCAAMLYPLVESCMPEDYLRVWQRSMNLTTVKEPHVRLEKLMEFLKGEVENEERIDLAMAGFDLKTGNKTTKLKASRRENAPRLADDIPSATELLSVNPRSEISCIFCGNSHNSVECIKVRGMDSNEKIRIAKAKGCCFACLKAGHVSKRCKAKLCCLLCGRKHVVLMCPQLPLKNPREATRLNKEISGLKEISSKEHEDQNLTSLESSPGVLLQTLRVRIRGNGGECCVRALIDTGSQRSYILERTVTKMNYPPLREEVVIHSLFGGVRTHAQKHRCYKVHLESLDKTYRCNFDVLDQATICSNIPHIEEGPWMDELKELNIPITDNLNVLEPIQLLIGADVAGKLMTGHHQLLKSGPVAVRTLLGWTLMGKIPVQNKEPNAAMIVTSMYIQDASIENLWKLDVIGISDPLENKTRKERELLIKEQFKETLSKDKDGRYQVRLPWKEGHSPLPSNRHLAEKRLNATSKKLDDMGLVKTYDDVLKGWLQEGIIERVLSQTANESGHYLPHRPILKETSRTTPVRPVFDASAREKNCLSLNQCLERGPNLLELIPTLLLRFRQRRVGVIADIEKAFLQIGLHEDDRDFLRFLWWEDPEERKTVTVFRHTRVVFGVSSSPFLLGAVIESHLEELLNDPSYEAQMIRRLKCSFYVDNVVTSVDSLDEFYLFESQARRAMMEGKFNLREWEHSYGEIGHSNAITSVLGICWDKQQDTLGVKFKGCELETNTLITKRVILSIVHKVYDPIGMMCPVLLSPKLLLQRAWRLGIDWDTEVSNDIKQDFLRWHKDLTVLEDMRVPRWIHASDNEARVLELHTFCDASKSAYAAVVYLRVITNRNAEIFLVAAKARVATVKATTIPRLELLAATIAARLVSSVKENLEYPVSDTYFWTDSSTVLVWIHRNNQWSVFVGNRVKETRSLSNPNEWRHVPTNMNPADLPSKGCTAKQLLNSKWWEGPQWLKNPSNEWPQTDFYPNEDDVNSEQRKSRKTHGKSMQGMLLTTEVRQEDSSWFFNRFSSYDSVVRLMGWVKRFIYNSRSPKESRTKGKLNSKERDESEKTIIRLIQEESFINENDNRLRSLKAYRDGQGILRVRTRILLQEDTDFCRPMVLPSGHPVVKKLIMTEHKKHCHAGVQMLLNILREHYWIINGRRTIRSTLTECARCRRQDSCRVNAPIAPLPDDRVRDAAVFEVTGIDLAGPLFLKNREKAWICLFTCAVYRAIHLELVTSISTEAFLQAFRRFIARRGRPSIVYSDNGTNFVGAVNTFKSVDWNAIAEYSSANRIDWKFNPPSAAWWGGWWERLIRVVKQLLRKTLGRASLTYEEMITVLCDCEAVVNSRPLTYVTENDAELVPLSPSLFLQSIKEVGVPECDIADTSTLNRRLRYRQKIMRDLRNRFRSEYLGQLVQRAADSKGKYRKISVGEVVLIGFDNLKRLDWPLGRITEIIAGKDGIIRLVRVKTSNSELLRPIQRIYPLEVTSEEPICRTGRQKRQVLISPDNERSSHMASDSGNTSEPQVTRSGRIVKMPERLNVIWGNESSKNSKRRT